MRTLVIVRHGETVGNSSIRYFGRTDLELSELGREQMRAVRRWLQNHFGAPRFAPVMASPLRRAKEGAAIIAGADSPIVEIEEFVEVDFGRFEGLTAGEIETLFPAEFERWNRDRLNPSFSYPGGESRRDFTDRVTRGIDRLQSALGQAPQPQSASRRESTSHSQRSAGAATEQPVMAGAKTGTADDFQPSAGEVALVVAHRGVNRIICKRLAGVEPQIELGSIQILESALPAGASRNWSYDPTQPPAVDAWRVASIDIIEHLAGLSVR